MIVRSEKRTGSLLTLVNDLLALVTGEIGKLRKVEKSSVSINKSLKETLHFMQEKAKVKDVKMAINSETAPSYLNIVPDDLEIIITNLIDNAIKYTERGGTIVINTKTTDKEIILKISDTGIGIHEDGRW